MVTKTLETPADGLEALKVGKGVPKWARGITWFLTIKELSSEKEKERKVKNKTTQFIFLDGKL